MSDNNIYFKDNNTQQQKNYRYTEHISSEQLNAPVGAHAMGSIRDIYGKPEQSGKNKRKKKKKSIFRKLITAVIVLTVLLAASSGALIYGANYILEDYTPADFDENRYAQEDALLYSDEIINILLIGMDTVSTDEDTRSDTMLLFSVDTKSSQIKLTSFLRDMYAYIPGHGTAKLNAACTYGGAQLVCDTIEYNFGIRIDAYVKTGYDMFLRIIDAVGGITIAEIDETEARALELEGFSVSAQKDIELTSEQALAYCRIRKGQDDFFRTERQREVINATLDKISEMPPDKIIRIARDIAGDIQCSFTKEELIRTALKAVPCIRGTAPELSVPVQGSWHNETINGQAVLAADFEENKQKLEEFLYN